MRRRSITLLATLALAVAAGCSRGEDSPKALTELQRTRTGELDVVMLSERDALSQSKGGFVLEFRSPNGQLVNVGHVKVNAVMPMAGMAPMIGDVSVQRTSIAGRYHVDSNFSMAGTWRIGVEWNGPAGQESATLQGRVQ